MTTRRILAAITFGWLAAAALTVAAPEAHADSADLVAWAAANGYNGSAQTVIVRASLVCADLSLGYNGEQAARDLWLNTGIELLDDARRFVVASVVNLCPQYDRRGQQQTPAYATSGSVGGRVA